MPSGAHNTGGMAITGMATIGIGVGAADGSVGGIAGVASVAGVDRRQASRSGAAGGWRSERAGYIGASPRTAMGGFDEGAVVAFASEPLSNFCSVGVAAPLPSEPLPFLPCDGEG
jgi:hypothetical protein